MLKGKKSFYWHKTHVANEITSNKVDLEIFFGGKIFSLTHVACGQEDHTYYGFEDGQTLTLTLCGQGDHTSRTLTAVN